MQFLIDTLGSRKISVEPLDEEIGNRWKFVSAILGQAGAAYSPATKKFISSEDSLINLYNDLEKYFPVVISQELKDRLEFLVSSLDSNTEESVNILNETAQRVSKLHGMTPYPHQREGALWLSSKSKGILVDDPGLGKTTTSLLSVARDLPILVIGPTAARIPWKQEVPIWRPDYSFSEVKTKKDFSWPKPGELKFTTFDILPPTIDEKIKDRKKKRQLLNEVPSFTDLLSDFPENLVVIIDEIHKVSNPKTQRFQRIREIRIATLNRGGKVIGLTGTPLPNRQEQLWNLLELLSLTKEVFGSKEKFYYLFGAKPGLWGGMEFPDPTKRKPAREVSERLARVMLRRTRQQVRPDLPEKIFQLLPLGSEDLSASKVRDKLTRLEDHLGSLTDEELMSWLQNQSRDFTGIAKLRQEIAIAKIPTMLKYVKSYEEDNMPLVVASAHLEPIRELSKREGWGVISGETSQKVREQVAQDFLDGKLLGVGLTIRAGGVALSLHNTQEMLFVDLEWTPGDNSQAEDRILRALRVDYGCIYRILTLDHPLELRIHEILARKRKIIESTVDAVAYQETLTTTARLKHLLSQAMVYHKPGPTS